ncbi:MULTISPECIES: divergent polysaccharide deacetylase family protein [Paenibacillus]|uniref:divergent polysaccharide deacetylase family protein n=1 Tax=Paenibacillus TaxID=44249 RepID=UPI0022B912EA|nr:divergent polysaccharide deacetylase family protein [Paenibacillus caseinilyticus]MCZ8519119.1 divergent polysaccharide deacetylase family protein [Paenibacillus caseinilyticus]
MRKRWIALTATLLLVTAALAPDGFAEEAGRKRIAVVIDDFGNSMNGTEQMFELPIPFAAAVMPFLPTTKADAERAYEKGKEVLVHLPMEPRKGKASWLGPGAITTRLTDDEIREKVIAAIEDVPHAIGINNHMGSRATADERVMRVILKVCAERGLFFLDSRTTDKSVIRKLSKEMGVKTAENHIFMDDIYTRSHVLKQAMKVQKHVKSHEVTVLIGHVGPPGKHTAAVLRESISVWEAQGAQFVPVSELMRIP